VAAGLLVGQGDHARPQWVAALVPEAAWRVLPLNSVAMAVAESALAAASGTPRVTLVRATLFEG
jgi:hypothetical protein